MVCLKLLTDQPSEEAFNLEQFKPPDSNWVSPDLRRNEQGDWSNTFPNKESKDLTLENIWKNSESSDDKNILKRSSERKFFKESKSGRKHPDLRKHKEKQKKAHNAQKNKDKFKNLKGSGKKMSKKTKRKDELIENKGQTEIQKTKLNDKTIDKQQNYDDESESANLDDFDDSTHFYDNIDFLEIDESNIDNSQVTQDEKSSPEKENTQLESTHTIISSMKKKSKNEGHKNHINKAQIVSHPDSYSKVHLNKLEKKHNGKSLISDVDDNQQNDEALYSDWALNRKNKVANVISKKKDKNVKRKHFDQENYSENNGPINVKEKELKMLTHWASNIETDFDNTTDIAKKGNGPKLTNNVDTETKSKDRELKNNKNDRSNKELFDISDYYEDGNVDSNDENNKQNNKIDNASKNDKSSNFLDEVSKFSVFNNKLNNYDHSYITNKKSEHFKNKDPKDVRKTEMIRYIKNDVLNFQNKDKIMSERHNNKSSRKHFSNNKQFYRRKPKVFVKPLQCENPHIRPLFNHVERVYKLDPIAGDIELQNISQLIKKRSQRSYNHEKTKVLNTRQTDFERILRKKDVLGHDNSVITDKQKVKNMNSVHDVFGPKNEMDILYYEEQNRPLSLEQRHLDEYFFKDIPEKRNTETFENKFKQGWESLKSKVISKNDKTSKCGESSSETESYSESTEPISISSTQAPLDSLTKSCENNNSLDSKTNTNSNISNSNKETDQETSNNNDFLTGLLSERIVDEIFNRLQKSSKIIKDLGIGNNVQNVSFEKCIQSENNQELISLEIINKSMANLNSLIQLDTSAQKCYSVPSDIQSFLRYLFNVEYKSLHENYSNFTIADGSFIFNANYNKDMCPGEYNCSGEFKFENDSNLSNVGENITVSLDAFKENKNPVVINDDGDNCKDKIQFEKLNIHGNEMENQPDDKNTNSENTVLSKNIDHDVPKSVEIKKLPSDNIPDDLRSDTFEFADEYMPETKEINNRNKKTLLSVPNHKNLIRNERERLSDIKYIQRNPYTKYINNQIQERINRKDVDNCNKNAISDNMFLNNHRQRLLNNKLNSEREIPKGINPDVLDLEKVKKRKEKFNHIYYLDTPHFYPSLNEENDIFRNRFDEEENNNVDIKKGNDNLDEDGFESAHMEIAPMEYYDV